MAEFFRGVIDDVCKKCRASQKRTHRAVGVADNLRDQFEGVLDDGPKGRRVRHQVDLEKSLMQ
jgi:hypothetical protein